MAGKLATKSQRSTADANKKQDNVDNSANTAASTDGSWGAHELAERTAELCCV